MKRILCLLLATVLTFGCLSGITLAADPIAEVTNGTTVTKVSTPEEIEALISPTGTTVVKMLCDYTAPDHFITDVPTFTLDLNGFAVTSDPTSPVRVTELGTENTTTVVKNGVLKGKSGTMVAVRVNKGGLRVENCVLTVGGSQAAFTVYQQSGEWNEENLITGCTLVGNIGGAFAFNSNSYAQTDVAYTIENSTLINARGEGGAYPVNLRMANGGTVKLGKNVDIYSFEDLEWIHPDLKSEGEVPVAKGKTGAFTVPMLGETFTNLYWWQTADGGMVNTTAKKIENPKEDAADGKGKTSVELKAKAKFSDLTADHANFDAIDLTVRAGIFKGYKKGFFQSKAHFAPDATITTGEYLAAMFRLLYPDLRVAEPAGKTWWQEYYNIAKEANIITEETGDMTAPITGDGMALMLLFMAPSLCDAVDLPMDTATRGEAAEILATLLLAKNSRTEPVLPTIEIEETPENRARAITVTAKAYYNKVPYVQYDNRALSRAGMDWGARYHQDPERNLPEYASEDINLYAVCTFFAQICLNQIFGYTILGDMHDATTEVLSAITQKQVGDIFVYQYTNTGDKEKDLAALETFRSLIQPGDIISFRKTQEYGHTVIYTHDVDGDGVNDVIHCSDREEGGGRYDPTTGVDKVEKSGGIVMNDITGNNSEYYFFNENGGAYLPKQLRWSILRPIVLDSEKYPISERTKTRMLYPELTTTYTADCRFYGSVEQGKGITYTLTAENKDTVDYTGIEVQIPTLPNAALVLVDGKEFTGDIAKLTLEIPAGKSVTHTFTYKVMGEIGDTVVSDGYIHTIPLPKIPTTIVSHKPTAEQFRNEAVLAAAVAAENDCEAFANTFYKAATGIDANLPTMEEVKAAGFTTRRTSQVTYLESIKNPTDPLSRMMVPDYYGGRNIREPVRESHHVLDVRAQDLQPGDVMYIQKSMRDADSATAWVFNGSVFCALENGEIRKKGAYEMVKMHMYDFFILLRPGQMQ